MGVLNIGGGVAVVGQDFIPIKGDVSVWPLKQVGVNDGPQPQHFNNRVYFFGVPFGQFRFAGCDLFGDVGAGAGNGLVQNLVGENHVAFARTESLTGRPGNHAKRDMNGAVCYFAVAHAPGDFKNLLKMQFLLGPDYVNVAGRVIRVPPVNARCRVAGLVQRRAIAFSEQAEGQIAFFAKIHDHRPTFAQYSDAFIQSLLNQGLQNRLKVTFADFGVKVNVQPLVGFVKFTQGQINNGLPRLPRPFIALFQFLNHVRALSFFAGSAPTPFAAV